MLYIHAPLGWFASRFLFVSLRHVVSVRAHFYRFALC